MAVSKGKTHKGYRLRAHDPVRRVLLALLAVVLLGVAAAAIYWAGYQSANGITARERSQLQELKSRASYLTIRNQELTDQAARLGRSGEIDREAARRVQKNLNEMEARLASLNEQVAFYRSIVSPGSDQAGVNLQHFEIQHAASGKGYSFKLALTQAMHHDARAKGHVSAEIQRLQDGKSHTLDLSKLAQINMSFSFKYFQNFQGSFRLPSGFVPENIVISVRPSTRNLKGTEKTYAWNEALKGG
jgi:hypothetical protein